MRIQRTFYLVLPEPVKRLETLEWIAVTALFRYDFFVFSYPFLIDFAIRLLFQPETPILTFLAFRILNVFTDRVANL